MRDITPKEIEALINKWEQYINETDFIQETLDNMGDSE